MINKKYGDKSHSILLHLPDQYLKLNADVTGKLGMLSPPDSTSGVLRGPYVTYSQYCIIYKAFENDHYSLSSRF